MAQNALITKCILRCFLKHRRWQWMDEVVQNVMDRHRQIHGDDHRDSDHLAIKPLDKALAEWIDILVVLDQTERPSPTLQNEDGDDLQTVVVDQQFVTDVVVSVLDGKREDEAMHKLLGDLFKDYQRFLTGEGNREQ